MLTFSLFSCEELIIWLCTCSKMFSSHEKIYFYWCWSPAVTTYFIPWEEGGGGGYGNRHILYQEIGRSYSGLSFGFLKLAARRRGQLWYWPPFSLPDIGSHPAALMMSPCGLLCRNCLHLVATYRNQVVRAISEARCGSKGAQPLISCICKKSLKLTMNFTECERLGSFYKMMDPPL
jgi:hypothetical protein